MYDIIYCACSVWHEELFLRSLWVESPHAHPCKRLIESCGHSSVYLTDHRSQTRTNTNIIYSPVGKVFVGN